jgi:hypothetical protein
MNCYRCGKCCQNILAIVPANETADFSPDHLESIPFEQVGEYIEANCFSIAYVKCPWLNDKNLGQCICKAYNRRGSDCINYCSEQRCNVGLATMVERMLNGITIPDETLKAMQKHPMYNAMVKTAKAYNGKWLNNG